MNRFLSAILLLIGLCLCNYGFAQGSRVLAPNYAGTASIGVPGSANDDFAWLEHDGFGGPTDTFLDPDAPSDERLYIYLRDGETLRYGIRRIPVRYEAGVAYESATANPEADNQDVAIILYDNSGTIVQATHMDADGSSYQDATLQISNGSGTDGIISTVAESLLGPEFTFNSTLYNSGGYEPLEYTNNTGLDQAFFISFLQDEYTFSSEAQLISDINTSTISDIDIRSWYDLWDFTVYDGPEEMTGRLYCQRWNFTTQYFENRLADEFQMYVRVPSVVGGVNAGNYIKELDLGGLDPFSLVLYANSEGADGTGGDTNGDGVTDFQDNRQSWTGDDADPEYDIFIQNPDLDVWPTTILPTVTISDATIYCNASGTGEAAIELTTNQAGFGSILVDLNGVTGYQPGTEDVIIEQEFATEGTYSMRWDGFDGLGFVVPSGTSITISGRFTAGPIHVPMYDVESNPTGITMLDVRPNTSFDLIYWDDTYLEGQGFDTNSSPKSELDGTNVSPHTWMWDDTDDDPIGGDEKLINTWSFGYYEINTENIAFIYDCDSDNDGAFGSIDPDNDNDGIADDDEGNPFTDVDADGLPDYLDTDAPGYVDSNGDGVNDVYDFDLDGLPDAFDRDSDNDGMSDMIENGLVDSNNDGTIDDQTDANANGIADVVDPDCDGVPDIFNVVTGSGSAGSPANAEGTNDGNTAVLGTNDVLILDMAITVPQGSDVDINMFDSADGIIVVSSEQDWSISYSEDGINYTAAANGNDLGTDVNHIETITLTASPARYIRVSNDGNAGGLIPIDFEVDYAEVSLNCTGGVAVVPGDTDTDGQDDYQDLDSDNDGLVDVYEAGGIADPTSGFINAFTDNNKNGLNDAQENVPLAQSDSDGDGIVDHLDVDSDNDGILDNVDGQDSQSLIASVAGDNDNDGLLDVYDPNNGGDFLSEVDTDGDGLAGHLDTDSDDDGVPDEVEGWDSNWDGFSDLDTNTQDGDLSNETGYNVDSDSDGYWDIYEGGTVSLQNTDGAGRADWQDDDDDNDGLSTSGEDANANGDWTDDKTQGQGGGSLVPDYLFRGDYDGDNIPDFTDADADNDGILDATEVGREGTTIGTLIAPDGDEDGDGIPNYRDGSDATIASNLDDTADSNADGVYDIFDTDLDGIPDFLDLDSDSDGLWDAIEADGGSVPNGLNTTTGQFALQDPDNDGLMNYVDSDDASSAGISDLANPDSDGDGYRDYVDIDSDDDGIPDLIEIQGETTFVSISGMDVDGDGIDDSFDPSEGGILIDPTNTDGQDLRDYLDDDSDNDGVLDIIESDDVDEDGYGDWDTNENNDASDETGFGVDTDGDGLSDIFDDVTLGTAGNAIGTNANLQNTDNIDSRNWRDADDDNDGELTWDEDRNGNGNFADDQTEGQGGDVPDFLFFVDFDNDGIADAVDLDSDGDGVADADEDGGEGVDPSADADGDGIPNYKDPDDPGLSSTADLNGDGVYDVFDADGDGIPDFRDKDSDNDGMPDIIEAGGADADGDGEVDGNDDTDGDGIPDNVDVDQTAGFDNDGDGIDDSFDASETIGTDTDGDDILDFADLDVDGDGLLNVYDEDNGGTAITPIDSDGDDIADLFDLDSDNDGILDIVEAGGTDIDGDGQLDDPTDTDMDGFNDTIDSDNGGSALPVPDSDSDGVVNFRDVDSDNDGITDALDNGGTDTNNDGRIDATADTDGDGLVDAVDPDNGGTAITLVDTDGDGLADYLDLDSDNDGISDITEAGGTDLDGDGLTDNQLDSDSDGIPDYTDFDEIGGADVDADGIDDSVDVTYVGGSDNDADGIANLYDRDKDGDGFDDDSEANPFDLNDTDGDGMKDFRDLDSDGDGIVDVIEFGGLTVDASNGQIDGFTDANTNGWNDTQESTPITPIDSDSDGIADSKDIDSDNDGIPDNIESQTRATYTPISDIDTDNDGVDDAYDPDNGGSLAVLPNSDGTGNPDYLDDDSDDDNVPDLVEGNNDDWSQYADWDTDNDNDITDEVGYNVDTDLDGLWDIFDTDASNDSDNVTGSTSDGSDSDLDGIWDFQDADDDGDGTNTVDEDDNTNGDPTDDFAAGGSPIPDYLFGEPDTDGDGTADSQDADSDNDGLADAAEDGNTGIDPSRDIDSDGILNAFDSDMDGDGILNSSDNDADGDGNDDTIQLSDSNGDNVADEFDKDLDGVPDFKDLDSDNDGIHDILEIGLTDANTDGTLNEGGGLTDVNGNGMEDTYDPDCDGLVNVANTSGDGVNLSNAEGANDATIAVLDDGEEIILDFGRVMYNGLTSTVSINIYRGATGLGVSAPNYIVEQSADNASFTQIATGTLSSNSAANILSVTITANVQYIRIFHDGNSTALTSGADINIDYASWDSQCTGTEVTPPDMDSDEVANYLDLDSDDDGITDVVEAQSTLTYVAPVAGDMDRNGVLDVFEGAGYISPENTDGADDPDYLDADSDNDGIGDIIEAFDSDLDGFGDWDSDQDNDTTDESEFNADTDEDGVRDIADAVGDVSSISNISGSLAQFGDTDADGIQDWRDTDDDDDGFLTSAEDANGNMDWTDDFNQGGIGVPDYLNDGDVDDDGLMDAADADADNDGIPNADEYVGATYDMGGGPHDDDDSDGLYNYLDTDDSNHVDSNGDGVDDRVDRDRDGVANFLDLDADNDGILDGIEANDGLVPTGFSTLTGRFGVDNSGGDDDDDDDDGLNDNIDGTPLALGDFDSDGLADYLDLDSDNDGVTDNRESQSSAGFVSITNADADNDGLNDVYSGASAITPVNSDATGNVDYLDIDSDDDGVEDFIEAYDANRNGFSERDTDQDGDISDEAGYASDTDGDGIRNIFDTFSGSGISNVNSTYANLQDTDGDGTPDYRDGDDDNDLLTTSSEDANTNLDWTDDKVQGGGATPDYLYFNDVDNDGIVDGVDQDGDNDGLSNVEEYNNVYPDPFADQDGDGYFNYLDMDDPALTSTLTDSNGDGIWDEYDYDLDGFPNFYDLDTDNDGIPDAIEANGGSIPANANDQGYFPAASTDTDNDGWYDVYDTNNGGTVFLNPDTDGDGVTDVFDYDSDNDGINDVVEAGLSDFNGDGILDSFGDTDGDGLGNSVDSDNGGTAHALPNTDGIGLPNYLDIDADQDGLRDWDEGFDDDEDDLQYADYEARRVTYETANGDPGHYPTTDNDINGIPDYLDDDDGDRTPNFLDLDDLNYFRDSDSDGIVDFFDPDLGGTSYANVSGVPDNDNDGIPNYADGDDAPLPLDWVSFTAKASSGKVMLEWQTANEIDVSHFDIEHSTDGKSFRVFSQLEAYNNDEGINNYSFTHSQPGGGINYYRLNQVDFDGASDYSWVRVVTMAKNGVNYVVYPNPATDAITLQMDAVISGTIRLIDLSGRTVFADTVDGSTSKEIDLSNVPRGMYQLIIKTANETTIRRVMKE